jgi:hypothetical protein
MALLSFRGISTPSLPAQGGQRRFSYFNIQRGNPQQSHVGHCAVRMLETLSAEIMYCRARARLAREKGDTATSAEAKNDYLAAETRWLIIARSYELQNRLSKALAEHERSKGPLGGTRERVYALDPEVVAILGSAFHAVFTELDLLDSDKTSLRSGQVGASLNLPLAASATLMGSRPLYVLGRRSSQLRAPRLPRGVWVVNSLPNAFRPVQRSAQGRCLLCCRARRAAMPSPASEASFPPIQAK